MNEIQVIGHINSGSHQMVRQHFKKMAIPERMQALLKVIPYVDQSPKTLAFFGEHFRLEIGALVMSNLDPDKATTVYNNAKPVRR